MANFRTIISGLTRARSSLSSIHNHPRYVSSSLVNDISISSLAEKLLVRARFLSSGGVPSHLILEMPALSPTMNQGNIVKWRKKEGDKIDVGDVICEIETDKATLEFECLEEGFLARILAPEGSKDVLVGHPIAITVEDPEDIKNLPADISRGVESKAEPSTKNIKQDIETKESTQKTKFNRISPSAKLLIAEHKLDPSSLKASGPRGTLLKGDVLSALKSGKELVRVSKSSHDNISASTDSSKLTASTSAKKDNHEDIPNSQIRKVIAKRLVESKQNTPHFYLSTDVTLDPLLAFRKDLQEKHNVKVSVNDIVIKAVALALKNVPEANAYWNNEKGEPSLCDTVDISIAVATEKVNYSIRRINIDRIIYNFLASLSLQGLMTPIIRNADQKTLSAISIEVKELAEKARTGKLKPDQFQGGTFSISNLGMFPVDSFCAIINPPQACILAVGRGNKVVEPVTGSDGSEKPAVVTKMSVALSADNRVFDDQLGGKFLSALSSNFSDIRRLLL